MSGPTDIFDPEWRPGKGMLAKADWRARAKEIPFDVALAEAIEDTKAKAILSRAHQLRGDAEVRDLREAERRERRRAYPEASGSVRAVPTATETNRRKH